MGHYNMSVQTLIDKAAERVGNPHKLAKALGVASSKVYDWRDGRAPCSPADRARLAGFAGEDAVQELVRATLETARGDVRKDQLQKLLGKSLRAIGVALGSVMLGLTSLTSGPADAASYLIRCILC
jgi:DNA-binding transcriptional regulator YdaS (Cro superfamily)